MHRQDQVGLFNHLLAVEVEVGEVEEQRVLVGPGVGEVPVLVIGELARLFVDPQVGLVWDVDARRGLAPGLDLCRGDLQSPGDSRVAAGGVRRGVEVSLRHQVRVQVVVGQGAVLIRPGDPVDPKLSAAVVMAERCPQSRGLDEQLRAHALLEPHIPRRAHIAKDGLGDVRVDVKRGG